MIFVHLLRMVKSICSALQRATLRPLVLVGERGRVIAGERGRVIAGEIPFYTGGLFV